VSIVDRVLNSFGASDPETPPPAGMSFEQRAALIGALYELRHRDRPPLDMWIAELGRVLSFAEATKPLAEALSTLESNAVMADDEKKKEALKLLRIGLQIAELHPVAAFGGDVRHLLTQSVEGALVKSRPVRLIRLLLPTLYVLFAGGLLWGGFQVDGIKNAASKALTDIEQGKGSVQTAAAAASAQIGNLSAGLQAGWREQLKAQAESQLKEVADAVKQAKADAAPRVQAELDGIAQWGRDKRGELGKAVEAEQSALDALKPSIETAKAQVAPQIQARLAEIDQWGNARKNDLDTAATAMAKRIESIGSTVDKLKSDASIQTDAAKAGIADWGRTQQAAALKDLEAQKAAILKDMDDRRLDVLSVQSSVKTQLASIVNDVRAGEDDIRKRLTETQNRQHELDAKLEELKLFVDQSVRLQAVIDRADSKSTLTFSQLVGLLEAKDGIAIAAAGLSVLAIGASLWSLRRRGS